MMKRNNSETLSHEYILSVTVHVYEQICSVLASTAPEAIDVVSEITSWVQKTPKWKLCVCYLHLHTFINLASNT